MHLNGALSVTVGSFSQGWGWYDGFLKLVLLTECFDAISRHYVH